MHVRNMATIVTLREVVGSNHADHFGEGKSTARFIIITIKRRSDPSSELCGSSVCVWMGHGVAKGGCPLPHQDAGMVFCH
jgi:hypothetical protein